MLINKKKEKSFKGLFKSPFLLTLKSLKYIIKAVKGWIK